MIKTHIIKKLFFTTLTMFIILTIYTIPTTMNNKNILRTNLEIEDITNLPTNKIYLLNKDKKYVETEVFISNDNQVEKVFSYLKENNDKIPDNLNGYIPANTIINKQSIKDNILYIDLSKEYLNSNNIISNTKALTKSLLNIKDINKVSITVDNNYIDGIPKIIDNSIGINNDYNINSYKDINKVVIYYLDNNDYYIPVTKYLNDSRDKINIIIEELKNNSELISTMSNNIELIDYNEESNVLFLNFNKELLNLNNDSKNKLIECISKSVFENYDVNMVMFEVNNKKVDYRQRT